MPTSEGARCWSLALELVRVWVIGAIHCFYPSLIDRARLDGGDGVEASGPRRIDENTLKEGER